MFRKLRDNIDSILICRYVDTLCSNVWKHNQGDRDADKAVWTSDAIKDDRRTAIKFQINNMIDFYVVGISLGTAWAHPSSGDTVASVMIGGLRTVLNGAFPVHTNDLLCVYFDDERDFFEVSPHVISSCMHPRPNFIL